MTRDDQETHSTDAMDRMDTMDTMATSAEALGPFITAAHAVLLQSLIQALEPIFLSDWRLFGGDQR